LKANETFLKKISRDQGDWQNLTLFIEVFKPYSQLTLDDLSLILKETTKQSEGHSSAERTEFLKNVDLSQLRDPGFRLLLSREELSELAQRELGISKWKIMKMGKKGINEFIQNALENVDTLNIIAKRASSKE